LLVAHRGSLQERSPIFYRGIRVGEVQHYQLAASAQQAVLQAIVREEYAPLVRVNSKFWNVGGFDFKFGLFSGAELKAESPGTVLSGGIEFATPPELQPIAPNGAVFQIHEKPESAWKEWQPAIELHLPEQAPPAVVPPGVWPTVSK
jgi:paraquat-inducible protein B